MFGWVPPLMEPTLTVARPQQRMTPPAQLAGVFGFQEIDNAGHCVNGVFAQMQGRNRGRPCPGWTGAATGCLCAR